MRLIVIAEDILSGWRTIVGGGQFAVKEGTLNMLVVLLESRGEGEWKWSKVSSRLVDLDSKQCTTFPQPT